MHHSKECVAVCKVQHILCHINGEMQVNSMQSDMPQSISLTTYSQTICEDSFYLDKDAITVHKIISRHYAADFHNSGHLLGKPFHVTNMVHFLFNN